MDVQYTDVSRSDSRLYGIATTLCEAYSAFVPDVPGVVQFASSGKFALMQIRFPGVGLRLLATLFYFGGKRTEHLHVCKVQMVIQPLQSLFRPEVISRANEELAIVLAGSVVPVIENKSLLAFMRAEMDEQLHSLQAASLQDEEGSIRLRKAA